ncbi:MAG: amidohydrolase family protein [Planctomycetaceae bacterium]|nr:amidohydrolase family protein [Planctomycetaceae bacterium]
MAPVLARTDLDEQIWTDELADFVPDQVFDVHTHIFRWAFNTDPNREQGPLRRFVHSEFEEAGWDLLDTCDQLLMPGRSVERLAFPFPFGDGCDFEGSNEYIAQQLNGHPQSGALMLVHPGMSAEHLRATVQKRHFLGFKPYRFFSQTGDSVRCRITDFLPEHQIRVADELGLIVMMHLSRPNGICDEHNLTDLERLTTEFPGVRWILAHCARSYAAWPIERAGDRLRKLPNVWFDVSSVCEADAIGALLQCVGVKRVMYGSDDVPVGIVRGKYVAFGHAWAFLSETNHQLNLSHCDPRMTFTRYEQLRAMKRATTSFQISDRENRALFHDNARELVDRVRNG